jgi:hypothetical protein
MGATASLLASDAPDVMATRDALAEWPLTRVLALNRTFRDSGRGFLMDAATTAEVLDVPIDLASVICRTLSRNSKKNSVNVMTVLAVIRLSYLITRALCRKLRALTFVICFIICSVQAMCLTGQGDPSEKSQSLAELFRMNSGMC